MKKSLPVLAGFFLLFLAQPASAAPAGEPTRYLAPLEAVDTWFLSGDKYTNSLRKSPNPAKREPELILGLEIIDTVVLAGKPFGILLKVYDKTGLPIPMFDDRVTYECISGVSPVLSPSRWWHGRLTDTLVIVRPGRNVRLSAVVGDAVASVHLDVLAEIPDRGTWMKLAEEHLAQGSRDRAIDAFRRAASFVPGIDPDIERRIARIYLLEGRWDKAEEHYQRAIRGSLSEPE